MAGEWTTDDFGNWTWANDHGWTLIAYPSSPASGVRGSGPNGTTLQVTAEDVWIEHQVAGGGSIYSLPTTERVVAPVDALFAAIEMARALAHQPVRPLCAAPGCVRPTSNRWRYCAAHYLRLRRHGTFDLPVREQKFCHCGRPVRCKGLCDRHYAASMARVRGVQPKVARPPATCHPDQPRYHTDGRCQRCYNRDYARKRRALQTEVARPEAEP